MIDTQFTLDQLNECNRGSMGATLGLEFTSIGADHLEAKMPVDHRTVQPVGILNGGASAALAETVGSMASYLSVDRTQYYTVGLEIKCNHIKSAHTGFVYGRAIPIHLGKQTQVWQIRILDDNKQLICLSSLTVQVQSFKTNPRAQEMLKRSALATLGM